MPGVATRGDFARAVRGEPPHASIDCIEKESATLEYVVQLANGPEGRDADRYAAKILATILGDDSGSRLYWELVDSGLADQASLSHYDYQGTGLFMTYLSCEGDLAVANLARIADVYRQAEADGITAAELNQAKNKINSRVVLSSERPRGRAVQHRRQLDAAARFIARCKTTWS